MKKIITTVFAIGIMTPLTAQAGNVYVTAGAGVGKVTESSYDADPGVGFSFEADFDSGILLNGGIGYNFGNIRAEGAIQYQKNDLDTISLFGGTADAGGDVEATSYMLNGYFDINPHAGINPFVTAGIGAARIEANDHSVGGLPIGSAEDTVFAWQVGAGLGFNLSERVALDATYRYFSTDNPRFDVVEAEYASHNVSFNLRYNF